MIAIIYPPYPTTISGGPDPEFYANTVLEYAINPNGPGGTGGPQCLAYVGAAATFIAGHRPSRATGYSDSERGAPGYGAARPDEARHVQNSSRPCEKSA